MGTRVFIDTNILVYHYDHGAAAKQQVASSLFIDDNLDLVISTQVLGEFYAVVTRKLRPPISAHDAHAALERFAELEVVPVTRNLALDASRTSRDHQLSYWDALIVESAACQVVINSSPKTSPTARHFVA